MQVHVTNGLIFAEPAVPKSFETCTAPHKENASRTFVTCRVVGHRGKWFHFVFWKDRSHIPSGCVAVIVIITRRIQNAGMEDDPDEHKKKGPGLNLVWLFVASSIHARCRTFKQVSFPKFWNQLVPLKAISLEPTE